MGNKREVWSLSLSPRNADAVVVIEALQSIHAKQRSAILIRWMADYIREHGSEIVGDLAYGPDFNPPPPPKLPKPSKPPYVRPTPRSMTPRMRFLVFKRDNYRCQICGRSSQEDGVKLEVDHKLARSKGGSTEIDNLWTTCVDCNEGKRADDL